MQEPEKIQAAWKKTFAKVPEELAVQWDEMRREFNDTNSRSIEQHFKLGNLAYEIGLIAEASYWLDKTTKHFDIYLNQTTYEPKNRIKDFSNYTVALYKISKAYEILGKRKEAEFWRRQLHTITKESLQQMEKTAPSSSEELSRSHAELHNELITNMKEHQESKNFVRIAGHFKLGNIFYQIGEDAQSHFYLNQALKHLHIYLDRTNRNSRNGIDHARNYLSVTCKVFKAYNMLGNKKLAQCWEKQLHALFGYFHPSIERDFKVANV